MSDIHFDNAISVSPNPIQNLGQIKLTLEKDEWVKLRLYDNLGKVVWDILNQNLAQGKYVITLSKAELNIPAGVYHLQSEIGDKQEAIKIILK